MVNKILFNVSANQIASHGVRVLKIEGQYRGNVDAFIQVHDQQVTPGDGVVPIKSWYVAAGSDAVPTPFFQSFLAAALQCVNGLYICVSTTDGAKTLSVSKMDLSVELAEAESPIIGGVSGDLVTDVGGVLQVWPENQGPKQLLRVQAVNVNSATQVYLLLFGKDNSGFGDRPLKSWLIPDTADGGAIDLTFGRDGLAVTEIDAGAESQGCTLKISNAADSLDLNNATGAAIRAEYK